MIVTFHGVAHDTKWLFQSPRLVVFLLVCVDGLPWLLWSSWCRVGDCLLYANSNGKLNYYVGGEVITLGHLDRRMYMLGYLSKEGRVYLMDKSCNVASYHIPLSILEYQTAVVRKCVRNSCCVCG